MLYKKYYRKSKTRWQLLFLKKGPLFYFHIPRKVSKIKQGKKMSGLEIWTMERSFLQKLSAGRVFYILDGKKGSSNSKIVGKNHRQMVLKQPDSRMSKTFNAIHFNIDNNNDLQENFDQIAFRLLQCKI